MSAAKVSLLQACDDPNLFGLTLFPKQREILKAIDTGPTTCVLCCGRRGGKSTHIMAPAALHNLLFRPDLDALVKPGETRFGVIVATNARQATVPIEAARRMVERSPLLRGWLRDSTTDELRFELPGGRRVALRAVPCNSRGARGLPISFLGLDEAAFMLSDTDGPAVAEAIFTALKPSTAQFGDLAQVVIASTPNGESGLFYDMFKRADDGVLPGAIAIRATSQEMNPTLTAEYLAGEEARDPDGYRAEYLAQFTASGSSFFDVQAIEFEEARAEPHEGRNWVLGLDVAFASDLFGYALVGESVAEPGTLLVGALGGIKPHKAKSFEDRRRGEDATLTAVWASVEEYAPRRAICDQFQAVPIKSWFGRQGCAVSVFNLSASTQTGAFISLRARAVDGSLRLWRCGELLEEMRVVRAKDTERIHLPRVNGSHGDRVSALALAVHDKRHVGRGSGPARSGIGGSIALAAIHEGNGEGGGEGGGVSYTNADEYEVKARAASKRRNSTGGARRVWSPSDV